MFLFRILKRCHSHLEKYFFFWSIEAVMLFEPERICFATQVNILQYTLRSDIHCQFLK